MPLLRESTLRDGWAAALKTIWGSEVTVRASASDFGVQGPPPLLSINPGYNGNMDTMQPEELMEILGTNVRARRKELNLTQENLAETAEVTQPYIAEIEAGRASATITVVARMSNALKTTPATLLSAEMATLVES